jgi:RNA polymerase sigma-70 factor (ECF subfamily)
VDETKWLIAKEIPRLRRYARGLVGDPAEADDLVQDCLERAIRKRHLWTRRGSLRNWLYRILFNLFINQSGRRNRERRQETLDDAAIEIARPALQEDRVVFHDVVSAMHRLSDEHRAAIILTAVEGVPYDEAADVLGIPVGTLRSRLSRARERLRELYVTPAGKAALRRVK